MTKRLFITVTVLAMGFGMLLANAVNSYAIDAAIVKIWAKEEGKAKSIYADPDVLSVKKYPPLLNDAAAPLNQTNVKISQSQRH